MKTLKDISGQRFGKLTASKVTLAVEGGKSRWRWLCQCDCGGAKIAAGSALRRGDVLHCGCSPKHGMSKSPAYFTWKGMLQRCGNPLDPMYRHYGGRGITVCERWHTFTSFFADMGMRPDGMTLDRIDNNGNYEPGNCRWATHAQQARGRAKLDPVIASQIRWLASDGGFTNTAIAAAFGVANTTIGLIVNGKRWTETP